MTTELKRFTEAYASMTVAAYEPLIIRWYSKLALWHLAEIFIARARPTKARKMAVRMLAAGLASAEAEAEDIELASTERHAQIDKPIALRADARSIATELPALLEAAGLDDKLIARMGGLRGAMAAIPEENRRELMRVLPNLGIADDVLLPGGTLRAGPAMEPALPVMVNSGANTTRYDIEIEQRRGGLLNDLNQLMKEVAAKPLPASELRHQILQLAKAKIPPGYSAGADFLPVAGELQEALSPIGIAHFFRQMYFNANEGVGPIEEAFTVAPAETLEVVYESTRRQIHEESMELGSETVSETAEEIKNLDEVSDKVSSMIQRDSSAAMSANANVSASGGIGVWSVSAGASFGVNSSLSSSSQRATENVARRLTETTKRASERITKSFTVKTRSLTEITTSSTTRRVIANPGSKPVSYGLRRVFRRVRVKVQSLGPRLVWQLYVRNPGTGLARSKFVHFMESDPIADPMAPPATKPRPAGGTDTGSTSASLKYDQTRKYYVTLVVRTGSDRRITALSIDSITDLEGGGKEDYAPSARNDVQWGQTFDASTNTFTVNIGVLPGDAQSVQVNYTYTYDPGPDVMAAWESERQAAQDAFEKAEAEARAKALEEKFEREKALITERSKIRPRPANDLRREERYEVMNRMINHLFGRSTNGDAPQPIEIELFYRYFDVDGMFMYMHPSWWKPRYSPVKTGLSRRAYEITAESEPAPMGSSLGWVLQLDGDTRRNEFLNSPWVRTCLPIRPGREREAVEWLAKHIEGEIGYNAAQEPLKGLLEGIETIRSREGQLGVDGPDYVTVDSTVGAPSAALKPENVYPVIDEFECTVPTDGFVYDALEVVIP
jgi:hypothetical protein